MRFFLFVLFLSLPLHAFAQNNLQKGRPVEIEASQQMEWLRERNLYRATGDVVITQGGMVIKGDTAEAAYDPAAGPSALTVVTMDGNVTMTNGARKVTAGHAVYDLRSETLTMSGGNLTITAPDMTVTAHDEMVYSTRENKASASGKAEVRQPQQTLRADTITAWFNTDNALQRAAAKGHVVLLRQTGKGQDIVQADAADYDIAKNKAILTGSVKLTQGSNHMEGDTATIDLKSGASSLQNNEAKGGRVRAIFTPGTGAPLPQLGAGVPMIRAKKEFEPAYAVGQQP